jgi:hypothetical protein
LPVLIFGLERPPPLSPPPPPLPQPLTMPPPPPSPMPPPPTPPPPYPKPSPLPPPQKSRVKFQGLGSSCRRWGRTGGGNEGGQQRRRWQELTFHIFSIETEFWIVGVVGGGQRRNTISKKISNKESSHTYLVL